MDCHVDHKRHVLLKASNHLPGFEETKVGDWDVFVLDKDVQPFQMLEFILTRLINLDELDSSVRN